MTVPRFTRTVTPKERMAYAAQVRHALAVNPEATLEMLVRTSGGPRSIVQHIAARVRREKKPVPTSETPWEEMELWRPELRA